MKKSKNITPCPKEKKINLQITTNDIILNSKKKEKSKRDVNIFGKSISKKNKRKQVNGKLLLASFFEVVIDELKEKRLQRIQKIQEVELCQEKECK